VTPLVELSSVIKNYQGLRPLRVASLTIGAHDRVALTGIDQVTAQVLADLITGATLPDTGTITVFGRPTSSLTDGEDWLSLIERIGIVSERAVLLDGLTVIQNLAMPFSLDIEPPSPGLRERAAALAAEVGLPDGTWDQPVGSLDAAGHLRVRLGRALALDPTLLLWEHPSSALPRDQVIPAATAMRKVLQARKVASLTLTADLEYASAVADTVWTLDAATGRVHDGQRGWFGRRPRTL
jgi:polar amino acid transport system ATP-binding protein